MLGKSLATNAESYFTTCQTQETERAIVSVCVKALWFDCKMCKMVLYLDQNWVKLLHTQPDDIRKESLEGGRGFLNQKLQNLQELGNDT